ncbi:MAG: 4Fe-4S dicluster domain-containing protein [Bradymonadales bacterium]|nr:4Fe-4S dicluster domain-containing protein [Bradymonadales bacterium]
MSKKANPVVSYLSTIWRAMFSTFEGLAVTFSWLFRRPITIQYPDRLEKPVQEMLPEGYRGILEVDLGCCTGCLLCSTTCPIDCIAIQVVKNPETKKREVIRFDIDIAKCMYCGLCTEACNFDALHHTRQFEGTNVSRNNLVLHFVKEPREVSSHKKGEPCNRRPVGSILPEVMKDCFDQEEG